MKRILFVCHGNICRSPAAEFVMKELVRQQGLEHKYVIESAATSWDECWEGGGNPVYPEMERELRKHGLSGAGKRARHITAQDYAAFDMLVGMDEANRRSLLAAYHGDPDGKISLLLDVTDHPRSVADPWYTRDFAAAYRDIEEGCAALLSKLEAH